MKGIGRGIRGNENWIVNQKADAGSLGEFSVLEGSNRNALQIHGAFLVIIITRDLNSSTYGCGIRSQW
jgi:hypothetical protein